MDISTRNLFLQNLRDLSILMKSKVVIILVGVAALLVAALLFWFGYKQGLNSQRLKDIQVEKVLEQKIDSLQKYVEAVEELSQNLEHRRDSLEHEIYKIEKHMQEVQEDYDEKISNIISYSNPQLEQFFLDRYGSN